MDDLIRNEIDWLLNGPFLMDHLPGLGEGVLYGDNLVPEFFRGISDWDMANFPQRKDFKRLGKYAESLIGTFIDLHPDTELLASGLQVRAGGRTLGEFDFIFRDLANDRVIHLELAIKFYLGKGAGKNWADWVGPASQDRLDLKQEKLLNAQVGLADTPEGNAALRAIGVEEVEKRIFLKGGFFRRWGRQDMGLPSGAHAPGRDLWWVPLAELDEIGGLGMEGFRILSRMEWMDFLSTRREPGLSFGEAKRQLGIHFAAGGGPQMLVVVGGCWLVVSSEL
ncbi:MAG: DUF1853 family protein [Bacteroidia bacterium]|nr:DUF1853 family protein [Bacteroidia bacterium]